MGEFGCLKLLNLWVMSPSCCSGDDKQTDDPIGGRCRWSARACQFSHDGDTLHFEEESPYGVTDKVGQITIMSSFSSPTSSSDPDQPKMTPGTSASTLSVPSDSLDFQLVFPGPSGSGGPDWNAMCEEDGLTWEHLASTGSGGSKTPTDQPLVYLWNHPEKAPNGPKWEKPTRLPIDGR